MADGYSERDFAERPPNVDPQSWFRLMVFDVAGGLTLEAQVQLPDMRRGGYVGTLDTHGDMRLSGDERFLYYLGEDSVGVIALDAGAVLLSPLPLPAGCMSTTGRPALLPATGSSIVVNCPTGPIIIYEPDGTVVMEVDAIGGAGRYDPPDWDRTGAGDRDLPVALAAPHEDSLAVVYLDGSYAVTDGASVSLMGRMLPVEYEYVSWIAAHVLDPKRLLLPYHESWPIPEPGSGDPMPPRHQGLVIFDLEHAGIEHDIGLEHMAAYPVNEYEVVLVGEGRLDILHLATMTIVQSMVTVHPERPGTSPAVR